MFDVLLDRNEWGTTIRYDVVAREHTGMRRIERPSTAPCPTGTRNSSAIRLWSSALGTRAVWTFDDTSGTSST